MSPAGRAQQPSSTLPGTLLLVGAVLLVLWPCLCGSYLTDDVRLIEQNPVLRGGDLVALVTQPMFGVAQGYWRPLTMLALWLGDHLGGAFGVHVLSLLLHLANVLAVRSLAARALPATPALWVALLFALHPVQVESVGWCAAINDLLWPACALQAMRAAVRWRDAGARALPWAAAAWVFAAITAKETGLAALALTAAALRWLPGPAPQPRVPWWRTALLLGAVALVWLSLRAWVRGELPGQVLLGSGIVPVRGIDDLLRLPQLLVAQLGLLLWPLPALPTRSLPPLATPSAVALAIAVGIGIAALWPLRRHLSPTSWLALALLLLPIAPTLLYQRVIGVYPIADRYAYLGTAGLGLLLAQLPRLFTVRWLPWLLPTLAAPAAFQATWTWYDADHFTAYTVVHAPDDPMVLVMAADRHLGRAYDGDGWARLEAQRLYERALAALGADVEGMQPRLSLAAARLGLAWCQLLRAEKGGEAAVVAAFRAAVDTAPENVRAWTGLGIALGEARQFDAARQAFATALQLDPGNAQAQSALARLRQLAPGAK